MANDSKIKNLIRLGFACNANCLFCNFISENEPDYHDFSLGEIKRQLDALAEKNVGYVSLSGGEPLLRNDLEEIISYAKAKGFEDIDLQTNGILMTEQRILSLEAAGLNKVFVSFHTHLPILYEKLIGEKDVFQLIVRNIKSLLKTNIEVVLNPVINQLTFKYLLDYGKFIAQNFPDIRSISLSVIQPHGRALKFVKLIPDYRQLSPYIEIFLEWMNDNTKIHVINPYCGLPFCIGSWYKHLENNVEYIENKDSYREDSNKIYLTSCADCDFEKSCNGVWREYVEIWGREETNQMLKPIKK